MMSNARVQTIITNAGPTRRVDYLPPGAGKQFHAGETLTLSGLLEEDLHLADDHRLDRFLSEQAQGLITVSYVVGGNSVPSLTQGSVAFGGLGGVITEDNANLFYDATSKQLGVGLGGSPPTSTIDMGGVYTARGISTPAVSAAGTGTLYFDSGSNTFQVSENGGPYVPLIR